jgi:threonine/homoserine/homoserine lactone efflux protein
MGLDQLATLLTGIVLGLSIAGPPGPVNATAAFEVSTKSWLAGWLVELGATTADGIFFVLTYYGLTKLIAGGAASQLLFLIGGFILLFLAYSTIRHAKSASISRRPTRMRSPYLLGLTVAMTNPYQIIWWVTVGVGMVSNFGLSIVVGLFTGILGWTLMYTTALSAGLSRYQKAYPYVIYASGLILGVFGIWFLITALSNLLLSLL